MIIFAKLGKIDILRKLYGDIKIANEVYREVVLKGIEKNTKDAFIIRESINGKCIEVLNLNEKFSETAAKIQPIYNIDIGEAETIALALQLKEKEAVIDEVYARDAARALGIRPIGSLRILLIAYKNSLIAKHEINQLIREMENSKYRLSPKVLIEFWDLFDKMKKKS
ncbi:hypothetical protein HYU10_02535 [Candidatus Woesearchaeota archaeon]|nr:hypothetical protein [Candidatus Woesearchaeota archaeon]